MGERAEKLNKNGIYWILALLCFTGAALFAWGIREREKTLTPQIIILGDSIFGLSRGEGSMGEQLEARCGMSVLNGAIGGSCLSRQNREHRMDFGWQDDLSMSALVKAAVSEDFSVQESIRTSIVGPDYFEVVAGELRRTDFDRAEILLIDYGVNDYHNQVPLDNPDFPLDETTFSGALRSALGALKARYPKLRILLVSSTYAWYPEEGKTCETLQGEGNTLEDYVRAEQRIAQEYGVELLDLYHDFYPHESMEDWKTYTIDGLHPNEAGREKIVGKIADYLEEHP